MTRPFLRASSASCETNRWRTRVRLVTSFQELHNTVSLNDEMRSSDPPADGRLTDSQSPLRRANAAATAFIGSSLLFVAMFTTCKLYTHAGVRFLRHSIESCSLLLRFIGLERANRIFTFTQQIDVS
jgi:hypothetical protein